MKLPVIVVNGFVTQLTTNKELKVCVYSIHKEVAQQAIKYYNRDNLRYLIHWLIGLQLTTPTLQNKLPFLDFNFKLKSFKL